MSQRGQTIKSSPGTCAGSQFARTHGSDAPLEPCCGSGAFLAPALGIYITPQRIIDYINGVTKPKATDAIGNPPFGAHQNGESSDGGRKS